MVITKESIKTVSNNQSCHNSSKIAEKEAVKRKYTQNLASVSTSVTQRQQSLPQNRVGPSDEDLNLLISQYCC